MPDELSFGRRMDGPNGRRRSVRERITLPVSLHSIDQSRVALLIDISETGCRLNGMGLPEVGQDVLLKSAGVELFGSVVWKNGGERGVEFDESISETEVALLRDAFSREPGQRPDIISPEGRRSPRSK